MEKCEEETEVDDEEEEVKVEGGVNYFKNKFLSVAELYVHFLFCFSLFGTVRCATGQGKPQALHEIFILAVRRHEETCMDI